MKFTFLHCLLVFSLSLLLLSCHERTSVGSLGEMETYFEEPLTSISSEGDSAFWLGSETGDIWYLKQRSFLSYTIEADRIYKIVTDSVLPDGKICWIGIHNSGLQKWKLTEPRSLLNERYVIPNKGYDYSVYDILLTENKVYVATSQGLYVKSRTNNANLQLVYPSEGSQTARMGKPFIVKELRLYENRYLLCSTQEGMLRVDLLSNKTDVCHSGEQIYSLSVHDDEICVLTPGHFYIESIKGDVIQEIELSSSPRMYYRLGGVHYFFNESYLSLSEDLKSFLDIPLRRKVPQFCNNVVETDVENGFTFLVTEHALWNIPLHLSVFNANGEIIASCSDKNNIYYLNAKNELYKQSIGESVASKIFEFPDNEVVSGLMSDENCIYYISNQRILKKIKANRSYIAHVLFSSPEILYESPTKITAFCLIPDTYGSSIYLGIQDDLVYIDGSGRSVLIEALHNRYITSFYYLPHSDKLYVATLNDGVYVGSDKHFQIVYGSEDKKFIRDVSVTNGVHPLVMLLTNHYLLCKECNDSVTLKGYNGLLKVNDSLFYTFPGFGLEKYVVNNGKIEKRGTFFQNICFNPEASFVLNDTLYLGSGIGVMKQNALTVGSASWIVMDSAVPNFRMIVVGISFVLIILFIICWDFFRRKQGKRKAIILQIDDLRNRLIDLEQMARLVGDNDVYEVKELINLLQHFSQECSSFSEIKSLSEKVMKKNRDIAFRLSKKLEKQIQDMNHYETLEVQALVNASHEALASTHLETIFLRIKENDEWLNQMADLEKKIKDYNEKLQDTLHLSGVNQELYQEIENFRNVTKHKTLTELLRYIEKIDIDFKHLYSDDALKTIDGWILKSLEKIELEPQKTIEKFFQGTISELKQLHINIRNVDRIILLKKIAIINNYIAPVILKYRILKLIGMYSRDVERVKEKNIGKYKEYIDKEIEEETKVIRKKTNVLIMEFYKKIPEIDYAFLIKVLQSRDLESQTAKALALLISMPNIKRSYIAGLLDRKEENLSPIITRLLQRIKEKKELLEEYVNKNHSNVIYDVLQLIEKER